MSKRRISQKQSSRIASNQQRLQTRFIEDPNGSTETGLVIISYGREALIETNTGERIRGTIRSNIDNLVAGDRVLWFSKGQSKGAIVSCCERSSILMRRDRHHHLKPVAANITQIMIVVAPKPEISWYLLDSYLVMAEHLNLQACIVLNKTDLDHDSIAQGLKNDYEKLGYSVLRTNFHDTEGLSILQNQLSNQINVFVGQSGVGKSSLIGRILPTTLGIETMSISKHSELGQHTTSNSYFYHLPKGGALIDSPGVREVVLWHLSSTEIANGYREFNDFAAQCKFRNCNHYQSAGCAVIEAVNNHKLSHARYENYVKLSTHFSKEYPAR